MAVKISSEPTFVYHPLHADAILRYTLCHPDPIVALRDTNISVEQIAGTGMGIGGFDWTSQRQAHLDAIRPLGLNCPLEIVNDATLGILAGSSEGWSVSLVAGTSCNARGLSRDHKQEGRAIGGWSEWSGEYAGDYDIVARAMRAVAFEWLQRGPATALTQIFLKQTGAKDLADLVEGLYLRRYQFEVILIGSLHGGHPLLDETLKGTILKAAPRARLIRLAAPPVVGAALLGMEQAGWDGHPVQENLIWTTNELMRKNTSSLQNMPEGK